MTTLQQQIIEVAEYDGYNRYNNSKDLYSKDFGVNGVKYMCDYQFDYHANIASLYPVAKRVKDELENLHYEIWVDGGQGCCSAIVVANNRFDVSQLFAAVHAGITFLKEMK